MSNILTVQTVSNLNRAKEPLIEISCKEAIEFLTHCKVEACSEYQGKIIASPYHPFVAAVDAAFCDHRPLVLSPDMFWLLIGQGFARHVNNLSEDLRHRFVKHDGKTEIKVRRDDFIKGAPENPWWEVFTEFSSQIKQHIGEDNYSNIVASFSTTGPIEKAANEIVLMSSMKNYFEYTFISVCGIPEVTLEGTIEDWQQLWERTKRLGKTYNITWWTNRILPTLERIARNAGGSDDVELWKNIYKINNESGGPYINGWVVDFFPYLQKTGFIHKETHKKIEIPNWLFYNGSGHGITKIVPSILYKLSKCVFSNKNSHGITMDSLPGSLCKAPFKWHYLNCVYEMEFLAGFIGFTQDKKTLAVRPKIGWAVREV